MSNEAKVVATLNAMVVGKALAEPEFRAKLLADPKGTVEKAINTPLPGGMTLKVVEATPNEYTVVLPYQPKAAADGELSDSDLEAVAGGSKSGAKAFFNDVADTVVDAGNWVADNPLTVGSAVGGVAGNFVVPGGGMAVGVGCKAAGLATGQS